MSLKKIITINIILFICIIVSIIGIIAFNNYRYAPYDPFNDLSITPGKDDKVLEESEVPSPILQESEDIINEYNNLLLEKQFNNIKIARKYMALNYLNLYVLDYIMVDTDINKITAEIILFYNKNNSLSQVKVNYRDINDEAFLNYNECLINISRLNISSVDKSKIISQTKSKPTSEWKIGTKYDYHYQNIEQTKNMHSRIKERRIFTIYY